MSKAFWVTVRKKVQWCDESECPFADGIRVGKGYSTVYCGALKRRIRWTAIIDFPKACPRGKVKR